MVSISPKKAEDEALDILNRVIVEKRNVSEFENVRIINCLDSLRRARSSSYDEISACYYAQIADIDNLLVSVSNVFSSDCEDSFFNIIYALNNAMRYREIYKYVKDLDLDYNIRDFLESAIKASAFCVDKEMVDKFTTSYANAFHDESAVDFLNHISEINSFFLSHESIKKEMSNYMLDCFDVFSRKSLIKTKEIDGTYGYSHHVFNDEGYEFLAFSFILRGDEIDMDMLIDIEDEFTYEISRIKYDPIIKTKISFNFELGDLS
ncbi:TPA: hypothetical protein MIB26_26745 [Klebsiella pneumoniae]|nr:hypothetical protein [Klebsiella pneumoniae]HBX7164828.1 hypothetical protein [Klebsiella pneumoniae]HBX7219520.1 hypothetical protein [Klebsiella pneumoniae]HBX7224904.1 hypothetical protein [Klebsiella pneumoniae]HBX7345210.1 hypothetical protein [Klebsiella pneumoniae]